MGIFKKIEVMNFEPKEAEEEWIWVEGYKGTDRNMCCRGYQYEIGKQYDMPEDEEIVICESGFHLCLDFKDVFNWYPVCNGNRFFKVKALVRKKDKEACDTYFSMCQNSYRNKLVAKSIIFLSELTRDEILAGTDAQDLPEEYKQLAIDSDIDNAVQNYRINILADDGYSIPFATLIVEKDKFATAHAFGSQKDLSMDMKVWGILHFE